MVLGFLGKGGSGKSSVATMMALFMLGAGKTVLAVDADHNMDLAYNLGYTGNGPYLGGSFLTLRNHFGLNDTEPTERIFTNALPKERFSFTNPDNYSARFAHRLNTHLHLMMSGPQNELVLHGAHCSHSLAAPLKIYLPLLELSAQEVVVVDEKASVDAVTTGIPTGFDLAVIVAEPRIHSIRAAQEIARILLWYNVPYITILNKVCSKTDTSLCAELLGKAPFTVIPLADDPLRPSPQTDMALQKIQAQAEGLLQSGSRRLERTVAKYQRNETFQKTAL